MNRIRVHLIISGLVQGVFYRAATVEMAVSLELTGWVRNLRDGSVELVAEGEESVVNQLIEWCGKGPSGARVDDVEIRREGPSGEFPDFKVRY